MTAETYAGWVAPILLVLACYAMLFLHQRTTRRVRAISSPIEARDEPDAARLRAKIDALEVRLATLERMSRRPSRPISAHRARVAR